MKFVTPCLQTSDIAALLAGTVPASQSEVWEEHFSSCEQCRMAMANQIGDQEWWREAEQSLKHEFQADGSKPAGGTPRGASNDLNDEHESIEELLKLLGPTDDPQMLGRIGSYEVLGVLGRGGMGVVFKAFDAPLNRFVAIKMLLPHLAASGAARKRFAREGQAVAAVVDDHVMAIHCVDEWQGVPYLVMTYSRGVSLQKRLSENGPLEVREILRIGMQAAKGLAAAHAQGIVHRDIKPANIFLDQNVERVQLMDFGLARAVDDASLTRTGVLAGTPQYMSPEQARAESVDHRSDLFSLGSVMYAMCTGHAPFRAESSYSVLRLITDKEPRPIREINPDIPEWLCSVISKLMAKQAGERFNSAQEVANFLEDCLAHVQQPSIAKLPCGLVQTPLPHSSSDRWLNFGVFSVLAAVGLLIVAMLQMQPPHEPGSGSAANKGGEQLASNFLAVDRDAGIANLTELLEKQRLREKSFRQLSLLGAIRQTQPIDTKRVDGESNEEFIKRYTSTEIAYDGLGPFPMFIERDYKAELGHVRYGDLHGKQPIMFREWSFNRDVFTQLMGVEDGHCQATITKQPADELRQPWSGWIRADVYALRPILDHELSTVLEKAAHTPGRPDPGGRPLFYLEKKEPADPSANQNVQWIATFLHQEPSEVNGRAAMEQLWYRVFWEQVDNELLITRFDDLSVVGGTDTMPLRVALVDDYRKIDGISVAHRVRTFMFANPTGMLGAEFVASDAKVNDAVVVPSQLRIPAGTTVRNELTGSKYRQPVDEPKSPQDSPNVSAGHSGSTTIHPEIPAEGKPIDKDKLLNELRERDRKFSQRTIELERTWDTLTSPRGEAAQNRHNSIRFGQADPGIPEGLPEDYQQPHRIRYIWTGQNFDSTLEILADLETAIHPEYGKLESRSIESDCFSYYRYWNRDSEIFHHSSDIAKLGGGKKAWEYLLPSGVGITQSILSVSNAVEVDDGFVLKGLVSLPSATIGTRKNCFEIHLDKELILRKAVIQYHVYDFVIVTTGRSEWDGMPPLAKHAAVSIHNIGQDEKRLSDVGNYKYELISLSEKLSKEEYDLRVNFAIPKGTKLSAGLNLVEVNLDGLPGVKQIERNELASRPEMTPREIGSVPDNPKLKRLQIREAIEVAEGENALAKPDQTTLVEFEGRQLRVNRSLPAVFTEDDIVAVESGKDPNNSNTLQILITLTPEAGERLLVETTRLSSRSAPGYLAIEFDGAVLSAPRVNSPISNNVAISFSERNQLDMERVVAAIQDSMPKQLKDNVTGMELGLGQADSLVQGNASSAVEAYVAAALAGDVAKAAAMAKNSPADPKRIKEFPEFLNAQRLKIQTVYVNDPAKPTRALATSQSIKLDEEHKQPDGQRDGFMVFTLEFTDDKWFVIDIDFESESGAEKKLKRFLEANPNSIGLPPLTSSSMPNLNPAADPADDHVRLQGAWQSLDSKELPVMPGGRNQFSVSFLTDRMSMSAPQRAGTGTFCLSPDTVPKQIDCRLTTGDKNIELKGIYEFRDSQLWLCLTEGEQRPKSFDNPPTVAGLMTFALERKQVELPDADSNASLALSDWSQSQIGAGAFATYTLSIPGIETIKQSLAAGGPAVKEFSGVPGFPGKVFTLRYFLPNLSPRGMAFVAGTSFQSSLDLIELAQVAGHKRLVKVFSYPDSATGASEPIGAVPVDPPVETPEVEPIESSLKISVLKAGADQADWLKEIDTTGEVIYGYEVVVQNANVSASPAGDAAKAAPAESPLLVEARKALQACQDSLSWKHKFDMRVTNSYVHSEVGKVTLESRVRRDAPRMVESSIQTFDDKPEDYIRLDNWCLDDGEMFISRTTTVGHKKLTGLMTIKGRQKASWRMFEASSFAMEGHFPGNQGRTLMELLMESKAPDVQKEKIGDHECLKISDRNDWGTMTVWIDAGPSRRLRQWESFKERGNRFADGRFGEDKDTANLESFSYFVDDIRYQLVDGVEIAISCRLRSTSIPNGGTKKETSSEYRRTEIHLRPDFETNNPFVVDFDNGARINDGDAYDRDTAFRWQDGKLTVPRTKPSITDESEPPAIDQRNARSVVEAYVAAALAGDVAKAAAMAKNSPADPKHIRELPEFLNVQRLKIETVYINDPSKPTRALATSVGVKLDEEHKNPNGQRDGFLVFTLEVTDDKWFVIDIDFQKESGAEEELNRFIQANPNSIGLPPLTSTPMPNKSKD